MSYDEHRRNSKKEAGFGEDLSASPSPRPNSAEDHLAELGYESELNRSRSTWQVAFMSCVLAAVPYGLATTLVYPLYGGGPVNIIWGWVAVCAIMIAVAASLGEITSVYPTAGGVYYQTFMVSPPKYRRVLAWICGWAYLLGNITITLAVNFGTTLFFIGCINIFRVPDATSETGETGIFNAEDYQIYLIFFAITIICNLISAFANRWLPLLDTATMYLSFGGVIAIIVTVLAVAKEGRHSAKYTFTAFEPNSGWVPGWSFVVGVLHAAYATSATGMVISMSEEVKSPATQVPKAMVGATIMNFVIGFVFLVPLTAVLPDISAFINDPYGQPVPVILSSAVGSEAGAFILSVPIIILGILCGTACTTATSRCVWAFARDDAMPGSKWLKQVNRGLAVPVNGMICSFVVQVLLGLIWFGSHAAFNAFNGVGVIFLNLSYVMPIGISLFQGRKHLVGSPYNLGKIGGTIANVISCAWITLAIPLFCMPSAVPVDLESMNYASVVFVAGVAFAVIWYVIRGRKTYQGPPAPVDTDRRTSQDVPRRSTSIRGNGF
ncbi:hypothetical protein Q7P37_009453 [Cladosporium fusiforme]